MQSIESENQKHDFRNSMIEIPQTTLDWLMDSDPAIRWQIMKHLLDVPATEVEQERSCMMTTGWCARLLALQGANGLWNNSYYNGKWLSTTYTLYLLKLFGLSRTNHQAIYGCKELLKAGLFGGKEIRFSHNQTKCDLGVTALVLSLLCYFALDDEAISRIAKHLIEQQKTEGNWLPYILSGAERYSFETTLLVLEALLQFQRRFANEFSNDVVFAVEKGQEFLLQHNLYLKYGKPIKSDWVSFAFPSYWFYDVLTALEYFRKYGSNRDARLKPAVQLVFISKKNGEIWVQGKPHPGKTYFDFEQHGKPSRWNTFRALSVLRWWENTR